MSRTDKDRPLRIRKHDTTELRRAYHNHTLLGKQRSRWGQHGARALGAIDQCDIDVMSPPHNYDRICDWELIESSSPWDDASTKRDRHLYWWSAERARTRADLHRIGALWSGDAEQLDDSAIATEQHRGRSGPGGGYWW